MEGPLNWPEPRRETFGEFIIRLGKQENNIAFLRKGDGNPTRQSEDIAVQEGVDVVPVQPDD